VAKKNCLKVIGNKGGGFDRKPEATGKARVKAEHN